ncbi:aromatic ring-hydroxylating dioxygenase subunit alpha [Alkalimonas sp. MEB108]|uniref:Aromatic ring-hydroxylating dioxygenase subunit alpha n=1 Tax=Alkalimonas cellulosilytica TaxID=3058395 RepID=A0ABU7JA52_9GAMM|nr:aromatic ring-hydroxylating dioxygenase subunit alpha [Alkalimonas sp. MEB108]MEE2003090.1 aromatic ring-hydroxylating dioxygenase subunit alpha [Alkalimonas sp. MEB108]
MIINLWYVAEWSETVKDKPVKTKVLGQDLVLFRDLTGKVQCLANVCLHRGGSLAGGWVNEKRDCVVCPYHGWEYDGKGKCQKIPSEGKDFTVPPRFRVDAYPVEERYGMIWVFMGDLPEEERYPIPDLPQYGDPEWRGLPAEYTWNAEAARVVENGIDIAHASFVHPVFGYPSTAPDNYIDNVEKHEWWGRSTNVMFPPQLKGGFLGWRKLIRKDKQETRVHPEWQLPGMVVRIQIDLRPGWQIVMFDANTPVDEHTTRTFAWQFRSFMKFKIFDKGSHKRLVTILEEDARIVEAANPYYLPETLANEVSVKSDKFMSTFRMARRKLIEEKGWHIDLDKRDSFKGRTVLTVPSPARREARENGQKWVFDAMPTIPPVKEPQALKAFEKEVVGLTTDSANSNESIVD